MDNNQDQKTEINVQVDAETYLEIQLAKIDDDIAEAEVLAAKAQVKVCELKKQKTKAFVDYHFNKLKKRQAAEELKKKMAAEQMAQGQNKQVPFSMENIESKPDNITNEAKEKI